MRSAREAHPVISRDRRIAAANLMNREHSISEWPKKHAAGALLLFL